MRDLEARTISKLKEIFERTESAVGTGLWAAKEEGCSQGALVEQPKKEQFRLADFKLVNLAPVCVLGLLAFSLFYIQWARPLQMSIDGQPVILVADEAEARLLLEKVQTDLAAQYPQDANLRYQGELSFSKSGVDVKAKAAPEEAMRAVFEKQLNWQIDGYAIQVGEKQAALLASEEEAQVALASVKQAYLPDNTQAKLLDAGFVEPVGLVKVPVAVGALVTPEAAVQTMLQGAEKIEEYVLKSGDSLWSIASKNNTTIEALQAANPEVSKTFKIGQVLKLSKAEPLVSVKTVVESVKEEKIPYEVVYEKDRNAYKGQQSVLTAGAEGKKAVTYQIAQVNGVELERKVISETVIAEPVDKVVKTGTRTMVASRSSSSLSMGGGNGSLAWPIRGRINSPYGRRGRGMHTGVDIEADKGDPIYSAASGTVVKASYSGGYGNCIIIDHGDGLSTLYAHMSSLNVRVGQKVGGTELIGLAGSTGNSTGPHCHFEVRINGNTTNPMNYLK